MVGGNMRQAGPLAAAGVVALETMVDRLAEDHESARRLARGFHRIDPSLCDPQDVETNLVRVDVTKSGRRASEWSSELKAVGVLVAPADTCVLRFVTHRHISSADVDRAVEAFAGRWEKARAHAS
jgi:threonine aldolase